MKPVAFKVEDEIYTLLQKINTEKSVNLFARKLVSNFVKKKIKEFSFKNGFLEMKKEFQLLRQYLFEIEKKINELKEIKGNLKNSENKEEVFKLLKQILELLNLLINEFSSLSKEVGALADKLNKSSEVQSSKVKTSEALDILFCLKKLGEKVIAVESRRKDFDTLVNQLIEKYKKT